MFAIDVHYNRKNARAADFFKGLAVLAIFVLVLTGYYLLLSRSYYASHLLKGDGSGYAYAMGAVIQLGKENRFTDVLAYVPHAHRYTVLQNLLVAVVAKAIPVGYYVAVIINAGYLALFLFCFYLLCWRQGGDWRSAALLSIPAVTIGPIAAQPIESIVDFHPSYAGTATFGAAVCLAYASAAFRGYLICAMLGVVVGLQALSRPPAVALTAFALLPFFALSLVQAIRTGQVGRFAVGVAIVISCFLIVSGWYFVPKSIQILTQLTSLVSQEVPGRTIGVLSIPESAALLTRWVYAAFASNPAQAALVLVLLFCSTIFLSFRGLPNWRDLDPTKLWVAISPIIVLAAMGSPGFLYAAPVFFGIYFCLVYPFRFDRELGWLTFLSQPVILGVIALVVVTNTIQLAAAAAISHRLLVNPNAEDASDAAGLRALTRAILADARRKNCDKVEVAMFTTESAIWAHPLGAHLVFEYGVPVELWGFPLFPLQSSLQRPKVVISINLSPYYTNWARIYRPDLKNFSVDTDGLYCDLEARADYVFVLSPSQKNNAMNSSFPDLAPAWFALSERLLKSPVFASITPPILIGGREYIILSRTSNYNNATRCFPK